MFIIFELFFRENENGDARRELDEAFKILASRENDGKYCCLLLKEHMIYSFK